MAGPVKNVAQAAARVDAIFIPDSGDVLPDVVQTLTANGVNTKKGAAHKAASRRSRRPCSKQFREASSCSISIRCGLAALVSGLARGVLITH